MKKLLKVFFYEKGPQSFRDRPPWTNLCRKTTSLNDISIDNYQTEFP